MSIIFILIPLGLLLLAIAIGAFFWAVHSGQFDDLDTPAKRILDDAAPVTPGKPDRYETDQK
ncbi:MAG: cbb3-type cytochrome oxidase assembly protein CcoS [Gammaproteobacteria bacterium]|nr:cbb3-type cytochrome oxidase assembly protein CcoS [Gammaproteobacteria bacterium]